MTCHHFGIVQVNERMLGPVLYVLYCQQTTASRITELWAVLEHSAPAQKLGDTNEIWNALDGIFACVIVDEAKGEFIAARDPIGVCSFYWGRGKDGSTWFASEMKALQEHCKTFDIFPPVSLILCYPASCPATSQDKSAPQHIPRLLFRLPWRRDRV